MHAHTRTRTHPRTHLVVQHLHALCVARMQVHHVAHSLLDAANELVLSNLEKHACGNGGTSSSVTHMRVLHGWQRGLTAHAGGAPTHAPMDVRTADCLCRPVMGSATPDGCMRGVALVMRASHSSAQQQRQRGAATLSTSLHALIAGWQPGALRGLTAAPQHLAGTAATVPTPHTHTRSQKALVVEDAWVPRHYAHALWRNGAVRLAHPPCAWRWLVARGAVCHRAR
jgi:hypothetical protein